MNSRKVHAPHINASLWLIAGTLGGAAPLLAAPTTEAYYMGGRRHELPVSPNWVGVQVKPNTSTQLVKGIQSEASLDDKRAPLRYASGNLLLLPVDTGAPAASQRQLRARLSGSKTVQRVVRLYGDSKRPLIDNGQFIVRFKRGVSDQQARVLLARNGATPVQSLQKLAPGQYLARASDPTLSSLGVSSRLFHNSSVAFSHPNFLMPLQKRAIPNDPLFAQQWHLNNIGQSNGKARADVRAVQAWDTTHGSSNITIAILDDGVDINHEDFGAAKMVPGYDFVDDDNDPSPVNNDPTFGDHHGTACAGVAAATGFNGIGVSGAAPGCKLMPVRMLGEFTTVLQQAQAFYFAAGQSNGGRGADVISNSWGPDGGDMSLPDAVKEAIDYAVTKGRGGKGCVVLFAAGNSAANADNDGYASYPPVISVSASTNLDDRARYSSFGESVDVCAPSGGGTLGITTVDRTGAQGYSSNNYSADFGGTSSSCPLVAGVAALVLSREPNLSSAQVRERLIATADKIDPTSGAYNGSGHSIFYGFGRVNAAQALALAGRASTITLLAPADNATISNDITLRAITDNDSAVSRVTFEQRRLLGKATKKSGRTIPDDDINGLNETLTVSGDAGSMQAELSVTAEIQHEFIGDLQVVLIEPKGLRTTLYNGTGGDAKSLSISQTLPVTARTVAGTYTLQVIDNQPQDTGTLTSFSVELKTPFTTVAIDTSLSDNAANGNQWTALLPVGTLPGGTYDFRATALAPATGPTDTAQTFSDTNTNITVVGSAPRPYNINGRVIDLNRKPVPGVRIVIEDGSGRSAVTDAQGNFSLADVVTGKYRLRAIQAGSIFTPEVIAVNVINVDRTGVTFVLSSRDAVAPTVQITTPNGGPTQAFTSLATVAGTATDNLRNGVRQVTVRLSRYAGGGVAGGFYNPTTKDFDAKYDPLKHELLARGTTRWILALPALNPGRYAMQATATDRANNSTRSAVVSFFIDRTNPTITIATPANNTAYTLGVLRTASGTASDNVGIARISALLLRFGTATQPTLYFDGRRWTTTQPAEAREPAATFNGKTWTLPLPTLTAGRYSLRMTARDRAGNASRATNIFNVAPSIIKRSDDVAASATISASALSSTVKLSFAAPINDNAEASQFVVTVNGTPVAIEGIGINANSVVLSLAEGALQAGDTVGVAWSGLNDGSGNPIADGAAGTQAK